MRVESSVVDQADRSGPLAVRDPDYKTTLERFLDALAHDAVVSELPGEPTEDDELQQPVHFLFIRSAARKSLGSRPAARRDLQVGLHEADRWTNARCEVCWDFNRWARIPDAVTRVADTGFRTEP